ncbi:MAG: acyltransferase [Bacteroidota bacterium]|nr:acyltransferase [Bacteroidota bacterium]
MNTLSKIIYKKYILANFIFYRYLFGINYACHKLKFAHHSVIPDILKFLGAEIGDQLVCKEGLIIDNPQKDLSNLRIGKNVHIGKNVLLDLSNSIILEEEVILSTGVIILTHSDCGDRMMSNFQTAKSDPVVIGKGSWLTARVTILNGVHIGTCCLIASGSVITKHTSDYTVVGGIPGVVIKQLTPKGQP